MHNKIVAQSSAEQTAIEIELIGRPVRDASRPVDCRRRDPGRPSQQGRYLVNAGWQLWPVPRIVPAQF